MDPIGVGVMVLKFFVGFFFFFSIFCGTVIIKELQYVYSSGNYVCDYLAQESYPHKHKYCLA